MNLGALDTRHEALGLFILEPRAQALRLVYYAISFFAFSMASSIVPTM